MNIDVFPKLLLKTGSFDKPSRHPARTAPLSISSNIPLMTRHYPLGRPAQGPSYLPIKPQSSPAPVMPVSSTKRARLHPSLIMSTSVFFTLFDFPTDLLNFPR